MYRVYVYFDGEPTPEDLKRLAAELPKIVDKFETGCCWAWIGVPDELVGGGHAALHAYLEAVKKGLEEKGLKVTFGRIEKDE